MVEMTRLEIATTRGQYGGYQRSPKLGKMRTTESVKIIRDRDEKPKGFGYIEFADLEGLTNALSKSGSVCELLSLQPAAKTHTILYRLVVHPIAKMEID